MILVTNDDGITAPGILNLIKVVRKITNRIVVVAPDSPQSGMGHAITMNAMLRLKEQEIEGTKAYACSGTPVDCIKIATSTVLNARTDRGQNSTEARSVVTSARTKPLSSSSSLKSTRSILPG